MFFFISNAIATPLIYLFDYNYYIKLVKRTYIEFKYITKKNPMEHSQGELNKIYESIDMSIALKYAYLGKTLLMTMLYIELFPLGTIISFIGLVLFYLIEKYNMIRVYKKPPTISATITFFHLSVFKFSIFAYAIGVYVCNSKNFTTYNNYSFISIVLFGVLSIVPIEKLFIRDYIGVKSLDFYEDEFFNFTSTYETTNPITKKKGLFKILEKMHKINVLDHNEYSNLACRLGNNEHVDLFEIYHEKIGKKNYMDVNSKLKLNKIINNSVKLAKCIDKTNKLSYKEQQKHIFDNLLYNKTNIFKEEYNNKLQSYHTNFSNNFINYNNNLSNADSNCNNYTSTNRYKNLLIINDNK